MIDWRALLPTTATALSLAISGYLLIVHPIYGRGAQLHGDTLQLQKDIQALEGRVIALRADGPTVGFPSDLLWVAPSEVDAEIALQDTIVKLAEALQLSLFSFGPHAPIGEVEHKTVSFKLEGAAAVPDFYAFLASVETLTPRVSVSTIRVRPNPRQDASSNNVEIDFQISLWAFWEELT